MQKSLCALFILLVAALPAHAQEKPDIPDPECDGGTFELVKCLEDATAKWDKRLNEAYRENLQEEAEGAAGAAAQSPAALGPVPRCQLQVLRLERGLDPPRSLWICMFDMTKARAKELEAAPGN